jgi:aspartate kinase
VRAVVGLDRVVHVCVAADELRAFVALAGQLELPLLDVAAAADGATCAIPLLNVPDWERCRRRVEETFAAVSLGSESAVVSVVGDGLTHALPRFLSVLDEAGARPRAIRAGPLRLAATVDAGHLAGAQRAMHAAFVAHR